MPLPILLLLVIIGVSLVVGAVHLAGGTLTRLLPDEQTVKDRFLLDHPDFTTSEIVLGADQKTALLFSGSSHLAGLVVVMGAHSLTRTLEPNILISVTRSKKGLVLGLKDMTLPIVDIVLSDPQIIDDVENKLKVIIKAGRG